ncbi:MAG: hypothetical protein O3B22_02275 [Proteobacteria bacterium]|nr:hypothetical protein [Pseudomonadota bacterium]MDA0952853.1 hypothetical protein [Pseudomonadota bacterium]
MRKLLLAGAAVVALTAGASAENQVILEPIIAACADGLTVADHNRDGWVTREEAEMAFPAHFELLDGDADGTVTMAEFMSCRAGSGIRTTTKLSGTLRASHPVFAADLNGDRQIDAAEWTAKAQELYAGAPKSAGMINNTTFDGAMDGFALLAVQADSNGDDMVGTVEAGNAITQGFTLADANRNGTVSFAEFATRDVAPDVTDTTADTAALSARLSEVWRKMDSDGSGGVTFEEFHAAGSARFERTAAEAGSDPDVAVPVSALQAAPVQ